MRFTEMTCTIGVDDDGVVVMTFLSPKGSVVLSLSADRAEGIGRRLVAAAEAARSDAQKVDHGR